MRASSWLWIALALLPSARAQEPAPEGGEQPAQAEEAPPKPPAKWFALVGGTVHTGTGAVIHSATVLARDGKVFAVGTGIPIPEGATRLEVAGRRVYPGLVAFDSQGLVGTPPEDASDVNALEWPLALSIGITSVGTGGSVAKLTRGTLEGHLLARNLLVRLDLSSPSGVQDLRAELERLVEYRREVEAAELKRSRGEEAPTPERRWIRGRPAELERLLQGRARAWVQAGELDDLLALCDLTRRYGFRAVVEGAIEAWTVGPLLARSGVGVVVVPRARRGRDPRVNRENGWTIEAAARLHGAGVEVAILSRSKGLGMGGVAGTDLWTLPFEAGYAVRGGLEEAAAIEALTLGPARLLGVAHRIGSLEAGKDCDLVVTSGDLLHYETLVEWAVVDGKVVYDKAKESLLRHVRPRTPAEGDVPEVWPRRPGTAPPEVPRRDGE